VPADARWSLRTVVESLPSQYGVKMREKIRLVRLITHVPQKVLVAAIQRRA